MEYLRVKTLIPVPKKTSVLINGQRNGLVGNIILLDEGSVTVSINVNGAIPVDVNLSNTTAKKPLEVIVHIRSDV